MCNEVLAAELAAVVSKFWDTELVSTHSVSSTDSLLALKVDRNDDDDLPVGRS